MIRTRFPWQFLPDLTEELSNGEGVGIVGDQNAAACLQAMAERIADTGENTHFAAPDVLAVDARCYTALAKQGPGENEWRGLLAMVLLWDEWQPTPEMPRLALEEITSDASALTGAMMHAMQGNHQAVTAVVLESWEHGKVALGMMSDRTLITPAAALERVSGMIPARVAWYDAVQGQFHDPCAMMNERDRQLLAVHLQALLTVAEEAGKQVLADALTRFMNALSARAEERRILAEQILPDNNAGLETVLMAMLGMEAEGAFPMLTCEEDAYTPGRNRVMLHLTGAPGGEVAETPQLTWRWRGMPIARTDSVLGVEALQGADAEQARSEIADELDRLLSNSPAWCGRTAQRMEQLLIQENSLTAAPVRRILLPLKERLKQLAALQMEEVRLVWPWPEDSGAVRLLVREALGPTWEQAAAKPFADALAMTDEAALCPLGFIRLQLQGDETVGDIDQFAAIPPLSEVMAEQIAMHADAAVSLARDGMCFIAHEEDVTAQYTLQGSRRVVFERRYAGDEVIALEAEETPSVAVWPCLPLDHCGWRSYYVYQHTTGDLDVEALRDGAWQSGEPRQAVNNIESAWKVLHTERYPACLVVRKGDRCIGALPNVLPPYRQTPRANAVIALDFGESGTAAAIAQGADITPLQCANVRRMLMLGNRAALADYAFVNGEPTAPVMPGAVETFFDSEDLWCEPLTDTHIVHHSAFDSHAADNGSRMHWGLKWRIGADTAPLRRSYLAQVMQIATLTAVTMGSGAVTWRISMPDDMAAEGRRALWDTMQQLARENAQRTGIPLTPDIPPVAWADESVALGNFFRKLCRQPVHGGFMTIDMGGGSCRMMLWLRGMAQPVYRLSLPMGAQHMLLEALLENPQCLAEDFAPMGDTVINERLAALAEQFTRARMDMQALEKGRLMLDQLLAENLPQLQHYLNSQYTQGLCPRTLALLLQQLSFLLMLCGMLQEQVYRDTTLNDYLPPVMEIGMAGRGMQLLYGCNSALQRRLSGFVRMPFSYEHPTREHMFIPSEAMKLEVALGLAHFHVANTDTPGAPEASARRIVHPLDPVDMLRRYLWYFRRELPLAALKLYPGVFTEDGYLTQQADMRLQMCVANAFAGSGMSVEQNCAAYLAALKQFMG